MSRMGETDTQQSQERVAGGHLRESAAQVGHDLREMGSQMKDVAQERFNRLRQQAAEYYEQGRERAREWEQNLEKMVQERPIKSLLIAAGVGVLLGYLFRRR